MGLVVVLKLNEPAPMRAYLTGLAIGAVAGWCAIRALLFRLFPLPPGDVFSLVSAIGFAGLVPGVSLGVGLIWARTTTRGLGRRFAALLVWAVSVGLGMLCPPLGVVAAARVAHMKPVLSS
jgi:hypothetical protein